MAALDFPASPIGGQQYNAPNGAVYTWDGTAWVVSGVLSTGSAAGGDLSGTYPNPQIATGTIVDADVSASAAIQYSKLTGVPTALPPSGAAGGDLAGSTYPNPVVAALAISRAKLAIGATNSNRVGVNIPLSFSNLTANTWIKVVDAPAITVRGGSGVLIYANGGGYATVSPAGGTFYQSIGRAGSPFYNLRNELKSPVTANTQMPIPPILFWDTPAAGTYTYSWWVWQGTNLLYVGPASEAGQLWVQEFS